MKTNIIYMQMIKNFIDNNNYLKAISIYNYLKYYDIELYNLFYPNISILIKRFIENKLENYIIIKIPYYRNYNYAQEKFFYIINNSKSDCFIQFNDINSINSFLLIYFKSNISDHFKESDYNILKNFFDLNNFFDSKFYSDQYKIDKNNIDIINHYLKFGYQNKYLPSNWFDIKISRQINIYEILLCICQQKNTLFFNNYQPKVSILVPIYNNSIFLDECITSLINQTLKDIEIILINDGSTDKKAIDIIKKYCNIDNRICLIDKKNTGYGHSMNCGLMAAHGEYIGIVESDDYVDTKMFEILYNESSSTIDIVKSNPSFFVGNGASRKFTKIKLFKEDFLTKIITPYKDYEYFNAIPLNPISIFKNSFIKINKIKFSETPGASFQDIGFYFKTSILAKNIKIINKQLYMVRRDNENSSVFSKDKYEYTIYEYDKLKQFLNNNVELKIKFEKAYYIRKYFSYRFTYQRIGDEYKDTFLDVFSKDFKEAFNKNIINLSLFNDSDKNWISSNLKISTNHLTSKKILVSVIIPIYNSEDTLDNTLNSILNQTLHELEIICIDDGSTDSSFNILNKYKNIDERIQIIKQENLGAGVARNRGIEIAKGEFLFFADSDDLFDQNCLLKFYNISKQFNLDICISLMHLQSYNSHKIFKCNYNIDTNLISYNTFNINDLNINIFCSTIGWCVDKFFSHDFIKKHNIRFNPLRIHNDMNFVYKSIILANKIKILNEPLVCKLVFNKNKLTYKKSIYFYCIKDALLQLKQDLIDYNYYKKLENKYVEYVLHLIYIYIKELNSNDKVYNNFLYFIKHDLLPFCIDKNKYNFFLGTNKDLINIDKCISNIK